MAPSSSSINELLISERQFYIRARHMYPKLDFDPFCESLHRVGRRCASNGIGRKLRRTSPSTASLSKKRRRPSVIPCQQPAWILITPSTRAVHNVRCFDTGPPADRLPYGPRG